MRSQIRKFNDVLEGRAVAVKVPRAAAKEYSTAYRRKGERIVVPVEANEHAFYSRKTGRITATRPGYDEGERFIKEFMKTGEVGQPLPDGYVYTIPLGSGYQSFDTWQDAVIFMTPYEAGPHSYRGALGDWRKYLIIERRDEYTDA
jgi:hypothetical protein